MHGKQELEARAPRIQEQRTAYARLAAEAAALQARLDEEAGERRLLEVQATQLQRDNRAANALVQVKGRPGHAMISERYRFEAARCASGEGKGLFSGGTSAGYGHLECAAADEMGGRRLQQQCLPRFCRFREARRLRSELGALVDALLPCGLHVDRTQDLNRQVVRLLATVEGQPVPEPLASTATTAPTTAAEVISAQLVEFGRYVWPLVRHLPADFARKAVGTHAVS